MDIDDHEGETSGQRKGEKRRASSEETSSCDSSNSSFSETLDGPRKKSKKRIAEKTWEWIKRLKVEEKIPLSSLADNEVMEILEAFSEDEGWTSSDDDSGSDDEGQAEEGTSISQVQPTEVGEHTDFPTTDLELGPTEHGPGGSSSLPATLEDLPEPSAAAQLSLSPMSSFEPIIAPSAPAQPPDPSEFTHPTSDPTRDSDTPFQWQEERPQVTPIQFTGSRSLLIPPDSSNERDFFSLMFNEQFFQLVLRETEFFAQELAERNTAPNARITNWKTLTRDEFEKWLGLLFHMGHIQINRLEYYWKKSHLYNIEVFGRVMSRDRFFGILQALHFARNPSGDDPIPRDRLFKIRPLVNFFNDTMRNIYTPGKQLSLDESMVLWRGRLVFRQYIKGKKHKYGIKLYMLTEPNGLVLRFLVYEGAGDKNIGGPGHRDKVVENLTSDFLGKGHSLFIDNWYNNPKLTRDLLNNLTTVTGTLQGNRKEVPREVVNARLSRGEVIQRWTDEGICVFKWKDRRDVLFISSEFGPEMIEVRGSRQTLKKPNAILQYNKFMGGIDRLDQLLAYYNCEHKTLKWYKKLGIHIMQIMLTNCYLLHKQFTAGPNKDLFHFRNTIVDNLVGGPPEVVKKTRSSEAQKYHLPKYTEKIEGKNRRKQIRCKLCLEKGVRRDVSFVCEGCEGEAAFCLEPCFKEYHIREKLI